MDDMGSAKRSFLDGLIRYLRGAEGKKYGEEPSLEEITEPVEEEMTEEVLPDELEGDFGDEMASEEMDPEKEQIKEMLMGFMNPKKPDLGMKPKELRLDDKPMKVEMTETEVMLPKKKGRKSRGF